MSRVASNHTTSPYTNGFSPSNKSIMSRSSSNASSLNHVVGGRPVTVRSAAPPPSQKETVHACPLCSSEYKDPRVLPCTHTYCFNCIRDKLIKNDRVTCPKCHHEVHPFDETHLQELQRNLILSQEWRIGARPMPSMPMPKKPVAYQSNHSTGKPPVALPTSETSLHQDQRKPSTSEHNGHGIASMVSSFHQASEHDPRNRSPSVSGTHAMVSNLIRIYSEATATKAQRGDSVQPTTTNQNPHDLIRVIREATNGNEPARSPSPLITRRESEAHEEVYEEMTWDSLVHGATPAAPPFPEHFQATVVNHHYPTKAAERPASSLSSDRSAHVDNLQKIMASIHQQTSREPYIAQPTANFDPNYNSRPASVMHSYKETNGDDRMHDTLNIAIPQPHSRQASVTDSVRSGTSSSVSKRSPIPVIIHDHHSRLNDNSVHEQDDPERIFHHSPSTTSSTRPSSDRFPPPPPSVVAPVPHPDSYGYNGHGLLKQRSPSSISNRSSAYDDGHDQTSAHDSKLQRTERFHPDLETLPPARRTNSSQLLSQSSTSTNRSPSILAENDGSYPRSPTAPVTTNITSRVDHLLSDQKRLEREIEEQIKRLKYDYDDIRKQIDRKQSSIHNEVKNIASRLDDDITEHYYRKQKIYAELAVDATTVGTELERLKSNTSHPQNNKQQLWDSLQQIESNIRNIRQTVDQHREPQSVLTFAEGHRTLGADTIGQITYHERESDTRSHSRSKGSPPPPGKISPSPSTPEQAITNLSPYKYLSIDHLSTLEPEAIATTINKKKILLGICNKLFVLNEFGDTLKTIQLTPSIRGIAVSKNARTQNIAYVSHDETVSMIDIDSGQTLDCVKETDSSGEAGTFLPLGIDTDDSRGDVYVCDYRNSCLIKFDHKLEFLTQWRVYNHSDQYDEARPKLISIYGQRLYMIVEHSCKAYYNRGIAYTFSLHICDTNSGNIIKIIDAELLSTQRLRWPCSVQAINHEKCYILDTMTSGKYFNGQWQKHWSRVLEIVQSDSNVVTELFQLDSEAATMTMTKNNMIIAANGEILFVDLTFLQQ